MNKFELKFHNIIFMLSTFWIAGFFFFPTGQLHNQAFIAFFVLPAIWLIFKRKIAFKPFLKSQIFVTVLIFCAYYAISTSWGRYDRITLQISEIKRVLYLYAFWLVIFAAYYLDNTKLVLLTKCIIFISVINLIFNAIIFYGIDHNTIYDRFNGFGRLRNQLWVAALYGAMAIMMLMITLKPDHNKKPLYFVLFLLFFFATLLTHSRGPIMSMLAVSIFVFYSSHLSLKLKVQISTVTLIVTCVLTIYFYEYYLADITRGQSLRLDLWLGFLEFTKGHLLLGQGAGVNVFINAPGQAVDQWSHYHNVYLGSLIELGLIGLCLHLLLVINAIWVGWRYRKCFNVNVALMIFIFTCLIGFTYGQGIITRIHAQWIIFWLPMAIIMMKELEENKLKNKNLF